MSRRLSNAALLVVLLGAPVTGAAQEEEVQVALDPDSTIQELDADLVRRLELFPGEHPGLVTVRLFQAAPDAYILEFTMRRDGRTVRRRVAMTAEEVRRLRLQVAERIARRAPEVALDQDGRHLLVGTTTLLGLGYWGWAVPAILNIDDARLALGTYMLTAGAGFLVPYRITATAPVTWGMANASRWGATRGIFQGLLLHHLVEGDGPRPPVTFSEAGYAQYQDEREAYDRRQLATALAVSLAGTFAGYRWAAATGMTAGDAHTIGNFGDFGMGWGGTTALLLGLENDRRAIEALVLGLSGAGLVAGNAIARTRTDTWGDAEIARAGHLVGALAGLAVGSWIDGDLSSTSLVGGALLAGSIGGTIYGMRAVRELDYSVGQGVLVDLGSAAGALIGLGLAVLMVERSETAAPFLTLSALGGGIGFAATTASLADDARYPDERRDGSLRLELSPAGLARAARHGLAGRSGPADGPFVPPAVPVLGVRYTF